MAPQSEIVWNDLQQLSEADQQELLARLMDRFEQEMDSDGEFNSELLRRAEELRADHSTGIPWEQVREKR